tara:strand:+ start:2184 stop:2510 length:327 start_codon:yes stop_codon:yes gene_type:complete
MTTTSTVLSKIFSVNGLKIIVSFLLITIIYNYMTTYIKLELGIIDLVGKYDLKFFKIKKSIAFGILLSMVGIAFYNILPFEKLLSNIFDLLNIKHKENSVIDNENFYF